MTRLRQRIKGTQSPREAVALDVTGRLMSARDRFPRSAPARATEDERSTCAHLAAAFTRRVSMRDTTTDAKSAHRARTASHPKSEKPQGRHRSAKVRGRAGRKPVSNVEAGSSGGLAAPDSASRPASAVGDRKPQERRPIASARCSCSSATEFRAANTARIGPAMTDSPAKLTGNLRPIGSADRTTQASTPRRKFDASMTPPSYVNG